jgi:hypothetical protein
MPSEEIASREVGAASLSRSAREPGERHTRRDRTYIALMRPRAGVCKRIINDGFRSILKSREDVRVFRCRFRCVVRVNLAGQLGHCFVCGRVGMLPPCLLRESDISAWLRSASELKDPPAASTPSCGLETPLRRLCDAKSRPLRATTSMIYMFGYERIRRKKTRRDRSSERRANEGGSQRSSRSPASRSQSQRDANLRQSSE